MLTKIRVVPLVKKELVAHTLYYNVPRINRACTTHQSGQDGVGGKHIALGLCKL